MKFLIKTLGCKVNQSESEELAGELLARGFLPAASLDEADITIINSCTVTSVADAKARQLVSKALKSSSGKVIVTGCGVANKNSGLDKFDGIELWPRGPVAEASYFAHTPMFGSIGDDAQTNMPPRHPSAASTRTRPYLKIQDGCSHRCSYCIVPLVRGQSQSIPAPEIVDKAKILLDRGFKEIVLTGVDIGAYGQKKSLSPKGRGQGEGDVGLVGLIKQILTLSSGFRIRLSSVEPQSIDERFLAYFAGEERICNHIHLPLQSGSDCVLKLMNRPYGVEYFKELCSKLKRARKGVAITTDVIVGFPGESEADFNATKALIEEIGFARTHIFRYSVRQGTPAADFNNQVSVLVKKERAGKLSLVADKKSEIFKKAQVGKVADVLIERPEGKYLKGTSSNYCPVYIEGKAEKGELVKVAVDSYKDGRLFGTI